jgi:hypothetical protein
MDFVPQLGRALGFTAEDLAANHEGRLSERQTLRLRLNALWYRLVAGAASLALTVVFAWGAFGLVGLRPMAAVLDLGFAACALAAAAYFARLIRTVSRDIGETPLLRYEGYVNGVEVGTERSGQMGATLSRFLECDGRLMRISLSAYQLIPDGSWRVFYSRSFSIWEKWATRYAYTALSIEPLSPGTLRSRPRRELHFDNAIGFLFLMLMLGMVVGLAGTGIGGFLLLAAIGVFGASLYAFMIWRGFVT